MFPHKKKNRTSTISVVVVDKSRGGFKEVKSFGVAKTEEEADRLCKKKRPKSLLLRLFFSIFAVNNVRRERINDFSRSGCCKIFERSLQAFAPFAANI